MHTVEYDNEEDRNGEVYRDGEFPACRHLS